MLPLLKAAGAAVSVKAYRGENEVRSPRSDPVTDRTNEESTSSSDKYCRFCRRTSKIAAIDTIPTEAAKMDQVENAGGSRLEPPALALPAACGKVVIAVVVRCFGCGRTVGWFFARGGPG
jgi:hypothetical protein